MDIHDLENILKLNKKRTPGEWKVFFKRNVIVSIEKDDSDIPIINWPGFDDSSRSYEEHKANADYIVACCNVIPALIMEIERMTAANAETCTWTLNGTSCGHLFYFVDDDGIQENGFVYCPFCGRKIVENIICDKKTEAENE
jgi:hypothetical protein